MMNFLKFIPVKIVGRNIILRKISMEKHDLLFESNYILCYRKSFYSVS
jgi:hypothetical protein